MQTVVIGWLVYKCVKRNEQLPNLGQNGKEVFLNHRFGLIFFIYSKNSNNFMLF